MRAAQRAPLRRRLGEDRQLAEQDDIVSGVAGRYASALFSLARDERKTDEVAAALANSTR